MAHDVTRQLQMIVNENKTDDIHFVIANMLLDLSAEEIEHLTINRLASLCFTSISTISRFSRSLGFESYQMLKRQCVISRKGYRSMFHDSLENMNFDFKEDRDILVNYASSVGEAMIEFAKSVDFNEIDRLIDMIHDHEDVYFFGVQLSAFMIEHFQFMLLSLGKQIRFSSNELAQDHLVHEIKPKSLAVIVSVDGNFIRSKPETTFNLMNSDITKVIITQNPTIRYHDDFDQVLLLSHYRRPKDGRYKLQLMFEILANRYFLKYGQTN